MVLLVGFSRFYLGAHYPSDVMGAAVAGLAWLALCLTAVDTLRLSRGAKAGLREKPKIQMGKFKRKNR